MPSEGYPRWFALSNGGSIYALLSPDKWVEHQKIGNRHAVHELVVQTHPDRLRIQDLLAGAEDGRVLELTETEYQRRLVDMASTPRLG